MNHEMHRAFVAIAVPAAAQQAIKIYRDQLAATFPSMQKTPSENFHITLHFFGDINEEQETLLIKLLEEEIKYHAPFDLQVKTELAELSRHQVSIIACKVTPFKILNNFAVLLDRFAELIHSPTEAKIYIPHLTLGKMHKTEEVLTLTTEDQIITTFAVEEIVLFHSQTNGIKPTYTMAKTFRLHHN